LLKYKEKSLNNKIYVGNLNYSTTEDELRDAFSAFGTVTSVNIIKDRFTDQSKGFAFVEMGDGEEAKKAIEGMNQQEIGGRTIKVDEAKERKREFRKDRF
jgi:RNA recognition motif-containing protein